ncbi:hypothetical protein H9Y05_00400 [Crocinitomicaceae bacterium CZZ-1]|uniref:Uncharacterized protein n=1 Tax=Taishania pollutisoli TaxID=2766479 RepID=A0A8J6PMG5_9FLAO|nr:hypothetical protein [Taishania pollutisoli]MBC9810923.1 hypothetical protein [Taishania pollutisoli]MBX2950080.1 hypothetical protein [Crocinitomicaceae bacterium]NGF77186.1 hypothetical protein [Fluviicola sp. SGL-29]
MNRIFLLLIIGSCLFFSGCIKNNPNPSWVEINKFTVESNPQLTEGELALNGFTNGWVYINDKFIGTFELPCKIPVLVTGQSTIRVYPTILNNGISATKKNYPFTEAYEQTVELKTDETVTVNPVTRYMTGTTFWIEDFQGGNIKLDQGSNSTASAQVVSDENNSNLYYKIDVNSTQSVWTAYTNEPLSFPIGSQIYLEFECNNTAPLKTLFMYGKADGTITEQYNITVTTANAGWKKVYIELTELVANSGGYLFWSGFEFSLPEGQSNSTVLIDNIKIVYR